MATFHSKHRNVHDVAVISIGNSLREDDGAPCRVVELLPEHVRAQVCLLDAGIHVDSVPTFLAGHQIGIIIDSIKYDARFQQAHSVVIDISDLSNASRVGAASSHSISWFDELVFSRGLIQLPPCLLFFGVCAISTGWQEGLSASMIERLPKLVHQLETLINSRGQTLCTSLL